MNKAILTNTTELYSDPLQPRKIFDKTHIRELSESILLEGIINPIEVIEEDGKKIVLTGECRWRAAKLAKLRKVPTLINERKFTYYEKLRHQMAENIHQSGSLQNSGMNALDIAKAFGRLIMMRIQMNRGEEIIVDEEKLIELYDKEAFKLKYDEGAKLAREMGVDARSFRDFQDILNEPEVIQEAIRKGINKSYFTDSRHRDKEIQEKIRKKILEGQYNSKYEIRQDKNVAMKLPDLFELELQRKRKRESIEVNKILNDIVRLALSLERKKLKDMKPSERGIVGKQVDWLLGKLEDYRIIPLD